MAKKIYKFPTGATIPYGAEYLSTVTQTEREILGGPHIGDWGKCWAVWHYFLVDEPVEKNK